MISDVNTGDPQWNEPGTTCPRCGYTGSLESFDCLGADADNVFCNECQHEFDPTWQPGPIHPGLTSTTTPAGIAQFDPSACEPINTAPQRRVAETQGELFT